MLTFPTHTSGQSQNIGPPLRPYTIIPTSHRLEAKMDSKVVIGKSLTMWATLPSNGSTIDIVKCQWTSPFGVTYNVEKNEVKSVGGKGPFQFMYSIGRFPEPLL